MKPGGGPPAPGNPGGAKPPGAPGKPAGGKPAGAPGNPGGATIRGQYMASIKSKAEKKERDGQHIRPPRPKPGAPGKAGGKGGPPGPPTPTAGPASVMGTGAPRPAGRATPGPAAKPDVTATVGALPSRALGSAGGGDSTERETMWAPRTMMRPSVRFSSRSMVVVVDWPEVAPGAAGLVSLRRMRRNSSVSARTRFMCLSNASIWPVIWRPSLSVIRMR